MVLTLPSVPKEAAVHERVRGLEVQGAVWTVFMVPHSVLLEQHPGLVDAGEELSIEKLIASRLLKLSTYPFSQELAGAMKSVPTPRQPSQRRRA